MAKIKEKFEEKREQIDEWIYENPGKLENIMIGTMWAIEVGYVCYVVGVSRGVYKSFNCMMDSIDNAIEQGALEVNMKGEMKAERFLNDLLVFAPDKKHRKRKW